MYDTKNQRETLNDIRLKDGETKRINCPFCGGNKTFTITRKDGRRLWNCYKASCMASGGKGDTRSLATVQNGLRGPLNGTYRVNPEPLPGITSSPHFHVQVIEYLEQVHAMAAYDQGLVEVSYAPKENRVLFWMNGGEGAVGRALDGRRPKWKAFGNTQGIFACGNGPVAIVVEDAASACAVGCIPEYTGVALLGTHLDPLKKSQLRAYERVVFCLDNDASKKSIGLLRKVEGLVPATVRFLRDDLKWMDKDQIVEILR
jgi:hypothetical protein